MKIQNEFSRNATAYEQVNIIQRKVLHDLIAKITDRPKRLLDVGCGSGGFYRAALWKIDAFVGIDFAKGMLALHPRSDTIELIEGDFNDLSLFDPLYSRGFDRIVSSSALQWATDLDATLAVLRAFDAPVSFSLFTSGTFRTLYEIASLPPLLRDEEETRRIISKHFGDAKVETRHYTLRFDSVREMFRYMKRSGVGAGRNILGYREMKRIMHTYPLDHLEYEVVFVHQE